MSETVALGPVGLGSAVAAPEERLTFAVHASPAPTWFGSPGAPEIVTPFTTFDALHNARVKPMPGSAWAPSLAESWVASEDRLTYEVLLRTGVRPRWP